VQLEIRRVGGSLLIVHKSDLEEQGIALLRGDEDVEEEDEENTKPDPSCLVKLIPFSGLMEWEREIAGVHATLVRHIWGET